MRRRGCVHCGGALHRANYPRKVRGLPPGGSPGDGAGGPGPEQRLSFCCAREGCRKRHTPASLRFLGRRVYAGAVLVLVMAMERGLTDFRVNRLARQLGVSRRTLERWRRWWRDVFPTSAVWRAAQGRLLPPVDEATLPGSLLPRFGETPQEQVLGVLRLLRPLSGMLSPDTS